MSSVIVSGDTSGSITLSAPAISGSSVLTLPASTDTLVGKATTDTLTNKTLTSPTISGTPVMGASVLTSGTSQASTSGTSIDFTGIPSWVKRITVMFSGVSTNGTSVVQVQLGSSGSVETTGYLTMVGYVITTNNTTRGAVYTSGFATSHANAATDIWRGNFVFTLVTGSTWTGTGNVYNSVDAISMAAGTKTTAATLDRIRITTVNGTDTFDAGSINILYE